MYACVLWQTAHTLVRRDFQCMRYLKRPHLYVVLIESSFKVTIASTADGSFCDTKGLIFDVNRLLAFDNHKTLNLILFLKEANTFENVI